MFNELWSTKGDSEAGNHAWWFSQLPARAVALVLDRITARAAHDLGNALLPLHAANSNARHDAQHNDRDDPTISRSQLSGPALAEICRLLTEIRAAMNGSALTDKTKTPISAVQLWSELRGPIRLAMPKGASITETLQSPPPIDATLTETVGLRQAVFWTCVSLSWDTTKARVGQGLTIDASIERADLSHAHTHRWTLAASRNAAQATASPETGPEPTPDLDPSAIDRVVDAWASESAIVITRSKADGAMSVSFDLATTDEDNPAGRDKSRSSPQSPLE